MSHPSVRRARKEDGPRIGALWMQLLQEQAALDARFAAADDALERWENDFPFWLHDDDRRVFVAEQGSDLVGFVTAHGWGPPPIYAEASEVYVDELYVLPTARGRGLGAQLVEAVRVWAEAIEADRLRVGVLAANEAGRAFWDRRQAQPFSVTFTIELQKEASQPEAPRKGRLGF